MKTEMREMRGGAVFVEAERSLNVAIAAAALTDLSFCVQLPRGGLSASSEDG